MTRKEYQKPKADFIRFNSETEISTNLLSAQTTFNRKSTDVINKVTSINF